MAGKRGVAIGPENRHSGGHHWARIYTQREADAALKGAKTLKDRLEGLIALCFAGRAAAARAEADKDTGAVRFKDGVVTVAAGLPKKFEWDQHQLEALVAPEGGENPTGYVEISFHVSGRSYGAWPKFIRQTFAPARIVRTAKPAFRLLTD